ncbi:MAG: hypothetical protein ACQSGP_29670 [Frankia sp.]
MNGPTTDPARVGDHAIDVDPVGVAHVQIAHVDVDDGPGSDAQVTAWCSDRGWE